MKHIQRGFALLAASLLCTTPLTAGMAASAYPQANHPDDGGETYIDASHTAEATAEEDLTIDYTAPDWSEIPFVLMNDEANSFYIDGDQLKIGNDNAVLTAKLTTESPATIGYTIYAGGNLSGLCRVYIDNEMVRECSMRACESYVTLYEELTLGTHKIRWEFTSINGSYAAMQDFGVIQSPHIEVSLLEPGSLGTEVLYHVDHLREARDLKVKGTMNDADWGYIKMMTNLCVLDLSEAQTTEVPKDMFNDGSHPFLHRIILPEGLKKIGGYTFRNSNLEEINFPSTLESIDGYAFCNSLLSEVLLPDQALNLGEYIFNSCVKLKKVRLPQPLKIIPYNMFSDCQSLTECPLPEGLETIGTTAFTSCKNYSPAFPESLKSIGHRAFYNSGIKEVRLGNSKVTTIDKEAFRYCDSLTYVEYPPAISKNDIDLGNCPNLKTLVLQSPTVVQGSFDIPLEQITLRVPEFAVNAYKLDSYWYN